jgi:hypothetical protein
MVDLLQRFRRVKVVEVVLVALHEPLGLQNLKFLKFYFLVFNYIL